MLAPWKRSYDKPRQLFKSRDITLPTKICLIKAMFFSSSHVRMWELDQIESWAPKNWCFWTVVLEKTLESPLDCKKIKSVNPKVSQSWIFTGRTDVEAETPVLWPPDVKNWLDRYEFEQAPGVGGGQGSLAGWSPWGRKESDTTERLNWTDLQVSQSQPK